MSWLRARTLAVGLLVLAVAGCGQAPDAPTMPGEASVIQDPPADSGNGDENGGKKLADKDADGDKAKAKDKAPERPPWLSVHEQGTIVIQRHPAFPSPYVGPNSLRPFEPGATTETATLFLDARLWRGGEYIFNPEISGGRGLSRTTGLAGFSNGEATRVDIIEPTPYVARAFIRQTWGLGGSWERQEDGANQLAGPRDIDRLTVSIGKFSAGDVFDTNRYSHDPRTQFLNWSLMYNGAWDYPADTRGYTIGTALDFNTVWWAARYGVFAEPTSANGPDLDGPRASGHVWELEEHWGLEDHPGRLRQMAYLNIARMGSYAEALALMPVKPDVTATRAYRIKYGFGLNLEQELTKSLGFFARAGWNDGNTETWAFTEIDRTVSAGLVLKGKRWRRPDDEVGLAGVINGLSSPHRAYLAAGGIGFIIGDGRLNYQPEELIEAYYNLQLAKGVNLSANVQGVNHPAYNADRGPVAIFTLRLHLEH